MSGINPLFVKCPFISYHLSALVRAHRLRAHSKEEQKEFLEAAASYERALSRAASLRMPHECARLNARLAFLYLVGLKEPKKAYHYLRCGLETLLTEEQPTDVGYDYAKIISD